MNTRRRFLSMASLGMAGAFAPVRSRPNIVVFVADDLGWGDTGAYGNKNIPTPNIDRLAREGVRLTNAYVTAAVCSPSRAGIMSCRYQARFGHDFNPALRDTPELSMPKTEVTIADRMRAAGYRTGLIGKWHLGGQPGYDPVSRGFDEFFGFASAASYIVDPQPGDETVRLPEESALMSRRRVLMRGRERVQENGYLTDVLTREAVSFIERHKSGPFFLMVTQHAPHVPLQATKQYLDRVKHLADPTLRVYAAMISALDDSVGAIQGRLEANRIADNTLFVFLSDNGCPPYLAGVCSNDPFSGHKRSQQEGGIRIPCILRYPARLKGGVEYSAAVISLDLMATALALGGADTTKPPSIEGVDLIPYLTGRKSGPAHNRFYWRAGDNYAIHEGDWKLWVVSKPEGGFATFLFDLKSDPGEKKNLAATHREIVQRLKETYEAWNRSNVPPAYRGRTSDVEVNGEMVRLVF